jgi:anti-sigma factor RsiW
MTEAWRFSENRPSSEELMAFADGELPDARRAEVAAWVAGHPDAAADIDEQQRLRTVWLQTAAPEPSAGSWDRALRQVESALPLMRPVSLWRRFRPLWWSGGLAASLALALIGRSLLAPPKAPLDGGTEEEPFPVAAAREIDILSMDAHDADALVVHPPMLADLKFVAAGDLGEVHIDSHPDGWGARLEAGQVPMVVALPARQDRGR